jgi:hypothetical protein
VQRFIRRTKRLLLGVPFILVCLASAESVQADSKVYQNPLHSTGLVEVPRPEGRMTYGTCWLADDEHTSEHSPRTTAKTNRPHPSRADQALTNRSWRPFPSGLVHRAEEPSTDWALATLLIGAVGLLLLLGVKVRGDGHPTSSTEARTWEVEKGAARGLLQDRYQTRA